MLSAKWKEFVIDPAVFLFYLGHFMKKTAVVDLIYEKTCMSVYDESVCLNLHAPVNEDAFVKVQNLSSFWILISQVLVAIPALLIALYAGSWSDRVDRKIPVIVASVGEVFSTFVCLVMACVPNSSLWLIVLGQGFSGFTGNYVTTLYAVSSYVMASCEPQKRTVRLAIIEGVSAVGATLGPVLSGVIVTAFTQHYVYIVVIVLNVIQFLYVIFLVESRRPVIPDNAEDAPSMFGMQPIIELWNTTTKRRAGHKRLFILFGIIIFFTALTISLGTFDILYLYVKEPPLYWSYNMFSLFTSLLFIGRVLGAFVFLPIFRRLTNASDPVVITIGVILKIVGLVLLGYMKGTVTMVLVIVLEGSFAFIMAGCKSIISKTVLVDEQGKIFSLLAFVDDIAILLATLIFNMIYPFTRSLFNGLIFECSAIVLLLSLAIAIAMIVMQRKKLEEIEDEHLLAKEETTYQNNNTCTYGN